MDETKIYVKQIDNPDLVVYYKQKIYKQFLVCKKEQDTETWSVRIEDRLAGTSLSPHIVEIKDSIQSKEEAQAVALDWIKEHPDGIKVNGRYWKD